MDCSSKASTSGEPQSQERNWGQRKRRSLSKKLEECNSEPKKVLSVSKLKRSPKPVTRPTSTSSKQNSDLKVSQVSFKASMPLLELHRLENFEKIDKLELNLKNSSMETVPMNPITRPSPDSIKIPVLECPEKSDNIISESPVLFSNALKKKGDPLEFFSNAKSNVESLASFTNLPTTVGAFEIRLNGSQLSQELHAKERHSSGNSFSVPVSSGITTFVSEINTEVPPRPLSPEVFIKTFDRSMDGSINKRKRRTPVKASLNSLSSLLTDHQTPYFNIETSANVNENIKEHAQASSDVDLSVKLGQDSSGNANKNFDLKKNKPICQTQEITTSIDISDKPAFNVNHNITTESSLISLKKSPKRKLQPSKIAGILEHPMKKSKNRVKFNPNISEVFTSPSDEEISLCKKSKTADFSSKEVLDESMLKLLHSRNVQVIFQKSKSNLQEHSVSRRNSSSRTKNAGKVNKSASNFQKVKEKSSQVSSSSLSNENEITTSNNSLDAIIDSVVSSAISVQTDSNPSGSIEISKKSVTPTARMRTGKVPIKSILKRKSISPKHKIVKEIETANMQTSKLQINRTELEVKTPVNEESNMGNNFKSPPIQKRKHKPNKKYDDGLDKNVHLAVSTDQPQALKNVESITDVLPKSKRKRTASTSKSKIVKPRKTTTKRKYCKKVSEKQPSIGAESSENQEGSSSETDDNMPIIYLLSSKSDNSKEKLIEKLSNSVKPINGLFELEKKDVRKRRGRGRKRQKIGRPKNIKVKEEVDADSSFLDEDDDEEHVIAANGRSPIKRKHQKRTGRRYSVTGNWYIASGYLNDILSLLEEFENCDGWRFKDFAKCWQKKSFSLVYRGRQTFKELLEFSEEIALLTMRFIGPSHATKRRIGALYTLYGLYYKFPVGHFFNLRFELEEYKNLLELVHSFRSNIENPDPAYIFRKLELKGAIQHCATACEPCYDFHNEERDMVDLEYGKQKLAKSSAVNIAVPNIQLEADSELLSCYNSTKSKLTGEGRALSLISPEFLSTISSDLSEMRKNAMCELGMTAKSRLNASTTDEEDCNADEGADNGAKRICSAGEGTFGKSDLDSYLHSVEDNVLNTVNQGDRAQRSLENNENILVVRDKSIQDFMKPPTLEELNKPLELANTKKKQISDDIDISLNLNDIKMPLASPAISHIPKVARVNLEATDMYNEIDEELLPQPRPIRKKRRGSTRSVVLQHAAKPGSRMSKRTVYNPCSTKSLLEESVNVPQSNYAKAGTSSTSLQASDIPSISTQKGKEHNAININVTLTSGEEIKMMNVKVKLTCEKLQEIQEDPIRLQKFKTGLDPLVKMSLSGKDKDKAWLIQNIELSRKAKAKTKSKSPVKPICFKQRFECLRQESPCNSSYSDSSSDESLNEDMPKRISKSKIDDDYVPVSDEEEYQIENDKKLDEEFEKEDPYESELSSPDEYDYPRRRARRSGYITTIERGPFDSDKLIHPKGNMGTVKMVPINVGGKTRYFPISEYCNESIINNENEESENEGSNKENRINELNTWNNFTSSDGPPLSRRRHTKYGREMGANFSFIYPRDPKTSRPYMVPTPKPDCYENDYGPRKIGNFQFTGQKERKFKEFFEKITRLTRTRSTSSDDDGMFDKNINSPPYTSASVHEKDNFSNESAENYVAHEDVTTSFSGENDKSRENRISSLPDSKMQEARPNDLAPTLGFNYALHPQNTGNLSTFHQLEANSSLCPPVADSNSDVMVPKTEIDGLVAQSIKKEFAITIDELVEDWDDDYQVDESILDTNMNENVDKNAFVDKLCPYENKLKEEPLETTDFQEILSHSGSSIDVNYQSDSEEAPRTINKSVRAGCENIDSVSAYPEFSQIIQPSEFGNQNILPISTLPTIEMQSVRKESLEEQQIYNESFVDKTHNQTYEDQCMTDVHISADDMKDILYCKVQSSDGKEVFLPVSILPEIKSDFDVMPFHATESKLSSRPIQSIASSLQESVACYSETISGVGYSASATVPVASTPCFGSSTVNVKSSLQLPLNSTPSEGVFEHQYYSSHDSSIPPAMSNTSNWYLPQKTPDFQKQARIQNTTFNKSLKPIINPLIAESTSSSAIQSPISTRSSISTSISKIFDSPSCSNVTPKCSFFFSPKLKKFTSKKVASGRPPSPEKKVKPVVPFLFKGKSWRKSRKT